MSMTGWVIYSEVSFYKAGSYVLQLQGVDFTTRNLGLVINGGEVVDNIRSGMPENSPRYRPHFTHREWVALHAWFIQTVVLECGFYRRLYWQREPDLLEHCTFLANWRNMKSAHRSQRIITIAGFR
jgi:hypothetical protein